MRSFKSILSLLLCIAICLGQQAPTSHDPKIPLPKRPPSFYTTVLMNGRATLVLVRFRPYDTTVQVIPDTSVPFSATARPAPGKLSKRLPPGSPDPLDHDFDDLPLPDLPEPDDFPEPPLPLPDWPDEDPFDGLPDPPFDLPDPPFDDPFVSDHDAGTVQGLSVGGSSVGGKDVNASAAVSLKVGDGPSGMARTPDRHTILVTNNDSGNISVIQDGALAGTISLPAGSFPDGIAITPDGKRAWVTNFDNIRPGVFVIDIASRTVVATVPVESFPAAVAITPDGSQAWVSSIFGNDVTVIDTLTNTVLTKITNVSLAWGIAFDGIGTRAYLAASGVGQIIVVDTATYQVVAKIAVGPEPRTAKVAGRFLFVTNNSGNTITQIDRRTNMVVRDITVGQRPQGIRFLKYQY